ncbi:hypothetical protein ANCDUO_12980 [Ancylostoma duodenale]|uniref:Uncharacterized protein n=1 Tax=Ancylostoma duodenale TaxID=51022 RepID=A0A0C2GD92_9BILA|nr:hypothetical protein ANCDUO_12980 [Ancylostoma duodenale]
MDVQGRVSDASSIGYLEESAAEVFLDVSENNESSFKCQREFSEKNSSWKRRTTNEKTSTQGSTKWSEYPGSRSCRRKADSESYSISGSKTRSVSKSPETGPSNALNCIHPQPH